MLTGFKVSLASKCVLYRPEHRANGRDPWNEILEYKDQINQQKKLKE